MNACGLSCASRETIFVVAADPASPPQTCPPPTLPPLYCPPCTPGTPISMPTSMSCSADLCSRRTKIGGAPMSGSLRPAEGFHDTSGKNRRSKPHDKAARVFRLDPRRLDDDRLSTDVINIDPINSDRPAVGDPDSNSTLPDTADGYSRHGEACRWFFFAHLRRAICDAQPFPAQAGVRLRDVAPVGVRGCRCEIPAAPFYHKNRFGESSVSAKLCLKLKRIILALVLMPQVLSPTMIETAESNDSEPARSSSDIWRDTKLGGGATNALIPISLSAAARSAAIRLPRSLSSGLIATPLTMIGSPYVTAWRFTLQPEALSALASDSTSAADSQLSVDAKTATCCASPLLSVAHFVMRSANNVICCSESFRGANRASSFRRSNLSFSAFSLASAARAFAFAASKFAAEIRSTDSRWRISAILESASHPARAAAAAKTPSENAIHSPQALKNNCQEGTDSSNSTSSPSVLLWAMSGLGFILVTTGWLWALWPARRFRKTSALRQLGQRKSPPGTGEETPQ